MQETPDLVSQVEAYFAAVDGKQLAATLGFLTPQARFRIATYGTVFTGHAEIAGMFERLFARYERIWHGEFEHVVAPPLHVATQFKVRNTHAGGVIHKNNCNFFRRDAASGRFDEVSVYMSGDNALA